MTCNSNYPLRGVNLGGWLVLERWITPGLFAGSSAQDEFSFMQEPGVAEKIERHRQEFITERDFRWLALHGINAVRVPVGYWVLDGDGPYTACVSYLDWAVEMAEKYDLKVLLDLHAAKGSQNGKDHSGQIGRAEWYRKSAYRRETIEILKRLAVRYKASPALWGIELLNEPSLGPIQFFILRKFYRQAYREVAAVARPGTHVVFSDGFVPWLMSGALRPVKNFPAVMDVHWYQFGKTKLERYFDQLAAKPSYIANLQAKQPIVVGEWSGMLSHKTLEGIEKQRHEVLEREHIARQLLAYKNAAGWFYWTYKTENGGIWSFREQVERGALLLG